MTENLPDLLDDEILLDVLAAAVGPLEERLLSVVDGSGGVVGEAVLRTEIESYRREPGSMAAVKSVLRQLLDRQREMVWDRTRRHALDRVLIERAAGLFPGREEDRPLSSVVSRRAIRGILHAVEMMVGRDRLEDRRLICKRLLNAHREDKGGVADWAEFHRDPEVNDLADDVLAAVAARFDDFNRRVSWMASVVDEHLAPFEDYAFEGQWMRGWELDARGARMVLRALFSRFVHKLGTADGRRDLAARHGEEAVGHIEKLVERLKGQADA